MGRDDLPWKIAPYGARLTFDSLISSQYELGVSSACLGAQELLG